MSCLFLYFYSMLQNNSIPIKVFHRKDEITSDFLQLVEVHIAELLSGKISKRYSASDFAAKLFIHPRHLSNTIKLTINVSPCDIMEERLVLEANKMLAGNKMPVAEIAAKLGYTEATNFTKFYKGMTGQTPLQYRKQVLEGK